MSRRDFALENGLHVIVRDDLPWHLGISKRHRDGLTLDRHGSRIVERCNEGANSRNARTVTCLDGNAQVVRELHSQPLLRSRRVRRSRRVSRSRHTHPLSIALSIGYIGTPAVRAAIVQQFGPPQNVTVCELPTPVVRAGEVVVQVQAAGVNYADLLMVAGKYQVKPPLPFVPGLELCGVIVAVGPGVTQWRPGDRIMGAPIKAGCFAEQVAVPADQIFSAPQSLTTELAAQFIVAHGTAGFAFERAGLRAHETVLVGGAGGGVGIAAVAVARRLGARVIAAAGAPERLRLARAHGAHETIDYRTEDLREAVQRMTDGRGVDVVLDPVGGQFFEAALRCTARRGRVLVVGFASGSIPRIPAEYLLLKNISVIGIGFGGVLMTEPAEARHVIENMLALHAAEPFTPQVDGRFSLEEVPVALQRLADRLVTGKQIVLPRN